MCAHLNKDRVTSPSIIEQKNKQALNKNWYLNKQTTKQNNKTDKKL